MTMSKILQRPLTLRDHLTGTIAGLLSHHSSPLSFVPPVSVTYETAQLTALMEMGTVGAGILANLTDFLLLILIAVFFRGILDAVPKLYSDFVDAWCVYTVQPKVKSRRVTVAK